MPAPTSCRLCVSEDLHGVRLQDFLERQWPSVDRKQLRALVRDGAVEVNASTAGGHARLCAGDSVFVDLPSHGLREHGAATSRPASLHVLAESAWCIVVDKPAGIPSVPDRAGKDLGVYGMLAELRPEE
ncbi:MAG: hypothetical protein KDB80_17230, partial [Planctomycetes bacterium]|nr:hypothetical protein [Planctomycetota bacterium]